VILAVDKVLEGPGTDLKWSNLDFAHTNYHFEQISVLDLV
jgi:hypothetical protein